MEYVVSLMGYDDAVINLLEDLVAHNNSLTKTVTLKADTVELDGYVTLVHFEALQGLVAELRDEIDVLKGEVALLSSNK